MSYTLRVFLNRFRYHNLLVKEGRIAGEMHTYHRLVEPEGVVGPVARFLAPRVVVRETECTCETQAVKSSLVTRLFRA